MGRLLLSMNHCLICISFSACLLFPYDLSGDPSPVNILFVANQMEHSVLLVNPISRQVLATVGVDINGHEVAVSPDGRFGYVPIYGNTWVGKPGSNGSTIHVVDLRLARTIAVIDLGKEVRPHCAHFGPDGLLYVSAELANAIYIVDTKTRSLVGEIPTGASHTHMLVIAPDGRRIYTANNEAGSVSVLDLRTRTLLATIPISKRVQRISISPDGKFVFTQDQETPRVVVIDTASNAVVRSISLPRIPFSSVVTKDGHWLLANSESGRLFVVDVLRLEPAIFCVFGPSFSTISNPVSGRNRAAPWVAYPKIGPGGSIPNSPSPLLSCGMDQEMFREIPCGLYGIPGKCLLQPISSV